MNTLNNEKTDVVSIILNNSDLLDTFTDTLVLENEEYEAEINLQSTVQATTFGRVQKMKCYLWKKIKDLMVLLTNKIQVLAILAEYNFKKEQKRLGDYMLVLNVNGERNNKEEHPDISHIPNDQPIPSEYPEDEPAEIPVKEPSEPIQAPIKDPKKNPKIRVLNIE